MNPRSTRLGQQLVYELSHLSRLEFQHKCCEILKGLYPHLKMASESGELDLSGIDLFCYDLNQQQIEFAFQCKGFEAPEFDSSHLAQCLKSIEKFAVTNISVFGYRLIVNKFIKNDSQRQKLQRELETLKAAGKAEYAELLDLNDFIKYVFDEVDIELRNSILKANQRFKEDYQRRMEQQFYQTRVPFVLLNGAEKQGDNPTQYLLDQAILKYLPQRLTELEYSVRKKLASPATRKQIWKFIISEFGFGKTSLLHNLFSQVKDVEILPLYIPIAQFDPESFVTSANAIRNMLEIILERKLDPSAVFDRILIVALREMLKVRQDLVLLFDGLDEHYYAYRENGLRMIFDCFRDFQPICLFTMRKEFWSDRQGDFQQAVGKLATNKDLLFLTEWHNSHIIEYLEHWGKIIQLRLDSQKISNLKNLVERNEYERYYGDIPKRPLFLKMLIDDIIQDEIKQKNLAAIYESYLIQKFDIDRETSVSRSLSARPLSLRGDRFLKMQQIFLILSLTASKMMYNDAQEKIVFLNDISDEEVKRLIKEKDIPLQEIVELLLNSVLVPIRERRLSESFRIKFAHKSFQEYFTARYLFDLLLAPGGSQQDYGWFYYQFSAGVETFLMGMLHNIKLDHGKYDSCISMIRGLYAQNENKDSIIARIVKFLNLTIFKPLPKPKSEKYFSCFVSYSSKDEVFTKQLVYDLQSRGVHCWFAPESLNIGQKIRDAIESAIQQYDKLIVIVSANSIESDWVEDEFEAAMEVERLKKRLILLPICLDDTFLKAKKSWIAKIRRTRVIGDFQNWQDHARYQKTFKNLLKALLKNTIPRS